MLLTPHFKFDQLSIGDENPLGVGLYLCKNIAQQFGGDLDFISEWGKGSTFIFCLDLETDNNEVISSSDNSNSPAQNYNRSNIFPQVEKAKSERSKDIKEIYQHSSFGIELNMDPNNLNDSNSSILSENDIKDLQIAD